MQLKLESGQGTRVILLRHGQSTFNALGLYQGCSDESVLTEVGRKDARITGNFLQEIAFDAIYISSLKRAQETAKEILEVITVQPNAIFISDKLRENHLPSWEGLAFQYVRETFPELYQIWKQRPHEFWMEIDDKTRFYPALDLYKRVQEFWQEVLPRHIGQTLLVVAHGGTNRALISTALGISPEYYHCFQQSNCGISIVNFSDGLLGSGQLEVMNLNYHLNVLSKEEKEESIFLT
ncbi:MAG TPA: histidine phosphatase family protein [Leptolyngbyaceae cyanobacterium]